MDAKDLRIGNYVYHSLRELDITISKSRFMMLDYEIKIGTIEPIPLTEEWLLRFGFEKNNWTDNGVPSYFGFEKGNVLLETDINLSFLVLDDKKDVFLNIDHVHQLQNLYFVLTNKELTL